MKLNTFAQPLRNAAQFLLKRSGREITRSPQMKYFRDFGVDCIFDVGANIGQYAQEMQSLGYRGRIESFEPLPSAYAILQKSAQRHSLWNSHNFALGDLDTTATINLSTHSPASSFLPLADVKHQVDLTYVSQQTVPVKRLDGVFTEIAQGAKRVFLKVDTQGFEREVLNGAGEKLSEFCGIQLEVSLVQQYRGESLIEEHIAFLRERSFVPYWCTPGYRNSTTLQLYQVDIIFFNEPKTPVTSI